MGPPDTKHPAKRRELDVHHINIAYDIHATPYTISYTTSYTMSYAMLLSGEKIMPAGKMYRVDSTNQKENIINFLLNLYHSHSVYHSQDPNPRPFDPD
jgi:hypothetical protein